MREERVQYMDDLKELLEQIHNCFWKISQLSTIKEDYRNFAITRVVSLISMLAISVCGEMKSPGQNCL